MTAGTLGPGDCRARTRKRKPASEGLAPIQGNGLAKKQDGVPFRRASGRFHLHMKKGGSAAALRLVIAADRFANGSLADVPAAILALEPCAGLAYEAVARSVAVIVAAAIAVLVIGIGIAAER